MPDAGRHGTAGYQDVNTALAAAAKGLRSIYTADSAEVAAVALIDLQDQWGAQ